MVAPGGPSKEPSQYPASSYNDDDDDVYEHDCSDRRILNGSPTCGKRPRSPHRHPTRPVVEEDDPKHSESFQTEPSLVPGSAETKEPSTKIARSSPVPDDDEKQPPESGVKKHEVDQQVWDDDDAKPSAKRTNMDVGKILSSNKAVLPLAANLREFMKPGATKCFRPRPEWYMMMGDPNSTRTGTQRRYRPSNPIRTHMGMPLIPGLMVPSPHEGHHPLFDHPLDSYPSYHPHDPRSILDINGGPPRPEESTTPSPKIPLLSTFGRDFDPALHVTIRESATEAAIGLLEWGSPVDSENAKGVTPLILASQKGNTALVRELLRRGAQPAQASVNGTTAVLQAAHFGHLDCLELLFRAGGVSLMEMANFNHTTPLMRAAQEGHVHVVEVLLDRGASVNRRNRVQMTALMLASQRGHARVCQVLVNHGADLDSMTAQHSTSLLLACKRGHKGVVRVLVEAGAELWAKDSRGRCAREVAQRRDMKELIPLIDSNVQLDLMQRQQRRQRNHDMVRLWNLLQQERAVVSLQVPCAEDGARTCRQMTIHQISQELQQPRKPILTMSSPQSKLPPSFDRATSVLLRTMCLPAPLLEVIATYIRMPLMWERRVGMLTKRSAINADATVQCALDLIDEVLEEGGFVEACDHAQVVPPTYFTSWRDWKVCCRLKCRAGGVVQLPDDHPRERPVATSATVPKTKFPCSVVEMRRQVGFLQVLANRPVLAAVLENEFNMPPSLIQQLITTSDIQSLVRRIGSRGVHFESAVAMDLVMLVSRLCSWFAREREDKPIPVCSSFVPPPLPQHRCRALPMRVPLDIVSAPFQYALNQVPMRQNVAHRDRPSAPPPGHG